MDFKDYSPMGKVLKRHIDFLQDEQAKSWERLDKLQTMAKDNEYADQEIQDMIYSERRVWSTYKHCIANLEIELNAV